MSATAQLLKDIGPVKLSVMAIVTFVLMVAFLLLSIKLSSPSVVPLYTGLDTDDSAKIAAKLEANGVYYEIGTGGSQIMVPADKVLSARMMLAQAGLPSGHASVGYEIFDKTDNMGVSSSVYNVNLLRALQGELERTISSFTKVEFAKVLLVMPKQDYFTKRTQKASASVTLKLKNSQQLNQAEVDAISHLVATSVPNLQIENITIVDMQGRPLKKGAENPDAPGAIASASEQYRSALENKLKKRVESLLERSVGIGRVEARVYADLDFDRVVIDSEEYDPDSQVARSVQTTEQREVSNSGSQGNVSAGNNIPGGNGQASTGGDSSTTESINEVTNFEVSRTLKKHIKETGTIQRLTISVLVDGIYELNPNTEEYDYKPRSQDELDKYTSLIQNAVGYDEKRGDKVEVLNMRFMHEIQNIVQEDEFEWVKHDLKGIIQTLVVSIVVILVILLIIKPMVNRAFEITKRETEEAEVQAALAGHDLAELKAIAGEERIDEEEEENEPLIDIEQFEERMNSSSVNAINDIIERHPEEAATIIRNWIDETPSDDNV